MPPMRLFISICAAILFLACFIAVSRAYVVHRAKAMIGDLENFDRLPDPTAASISFAKKYQMNLVGTECAHELGQQQFLLTNHPLSILHLATQTELEVL